MAKSPLLAALLSFFIAGLGQLYAGSTKKAAVFFGLEVVTFLIYTSLSETAGGALNLFVTAVAVVDAYNTAKKPRQEKKEETQPEQPKVRVF